MLQSGEGFQHNPRPGYGQKAGRPSIICLYSADAGVAELADAVALGATGRKSLEVQILSPAPSLPLEDLRWQIRRALHFSADFSSRIPLSSATRTSA